MPEDKQIPLTERWKEESNDSMWVRKLDGTQWIYHGNGNKEQLNEDDPRYDHWVDR